MNPRLSRAATVVLPSFSPSSNPSFTASSPVPSARTTSSSGITWAGLKKWRPRKRSARFVTAAWSATASDDVLVAKVAPSLTTSSTSLHISSFIPRSSVIASITRSQSTRSEYSSVGVIRPRTASTSDCSALPFSTARASCLEILPTPPSSFSWLTSRTTTSQPAWAQIWAIPWPIRPQPTTPTLLISIRRPPSLDRFGSNGAAAYTGRSGDRPGERSGENRLELLDRGAQRGELVDREVDLASEPVDPGERLRVGVEAEERTFSHRGHADRKRVALGDRDDRIDLRQRASAHVQRLGGPGDVGDGEVEGARAGDQP